MDNQLTNFPLFSSLPSELRFRIWKYELPDPRVVVLSFQKKIPDVMRDYAAEPQDPSDEEEDKDGDDDYGENDENEEDDQHEEKDEWICTTQISSTFTLPMRMVNHEARKFALESYEPTKVYYETEEDRQNKDYSWNRSRTYFDYVRDTVYISGHYHHALPEIFASVPLQVRKIRPLGGLGESFYEQFGPRWTAPRQRGKHLAFHPSIPRTSAAARVHFRLRW
jgi:hypothetical protein